MLLKRLLHRVLKENQTIVSISSCVHYCAFAYGRNQFNPYERYIFSITKRIELKERREEFTNFFRYYRPLSMAEALGVRMENTTPLWVFPWNNYSERTWNSITGWVEDPNLTPDILTHFSHQGILEWRILEEIAWLERAYYSIKRYGYQPCKTHGFISLLRLRKRTGEQQHIVLDGNHRISALSALGEQSFLGIIKETIREEDAVNWPGVTRGYISIQDALAVFNAYFNRSCAWQTTDQPATILIQ